MQVESIIVTHPHIDHVGGVSELMQELREKGQRPKLVLHPEAMEFGSNIVEQAKLFGLSPENYKNLPKPDTLVEDGDTINFGGLPGEVIFTPGHCPGHISIYFEQQPFDHPEGSVQEGREPIVIAGDTVFAG